MDNSQGKIKHRERLFSLVVGSKEMGKSTFVANRVKQADGNVIVIKHTANIQDAAFSFLPERTPDTWRKNAKPSDFIKCKIAVNSKKIYREFIEWVLDGNFKNGLLVIDDATMFERYRTSDAMLSLGVIHRHNAVDVILVYHGLEYIPNDTWGLCHWSIFFYTKDNFHKKAAALVNYAEISKAVLTAKEMRKNPATKWKPFALKMNY